MSRQYKDLGAVTAYAIAKENGFTGTEAEWLESLRGRDGTDGTDGSNGADGTKVTAEVDAATKKTTLVLKDGETTKRVELGGVGQGTAAGGEIFGDYSQNKATAQYAHAEGNNATASGACSHVEGVSSKSSGIGSHAEGLGTEAAGNYSHAEGKGTNAGGENSHAEGLQSVASGDGSHAEGQSRAKGNGSHAEGSGNANGGCSHAEAYSTATGDGSHAEGAGCEAKGSDSHAEGAGSKTGENGFAAHAEGSGTNANGNSAHAEGSQTTAGGVSSHAEGGNNTASGDYSHVEGRGTTASGEYAHAEGISSTASGQASHAEGMGSLAAAQGQHVQGKYNVEDADGTYAHIVGGGTGDDDRKNIQTLDWEGNETIAGDYTNGQGDKLHDVAGKLAKNLGADNAGKALLVGETGDVEPKKLADVMPVIESIHDTSDDNFTAETVLTVADGSKKKYISIPHVFVGKTNSKSGEIFNGAVSANGANAHAEGDATVASSNCQHVVGRCNVEDTEGKYIEIVGNGVADSHAPYNRATPSNARTLDWQGNEWIAGDYTNANGNSLNQVADDVAAAKETLDGLSDDVAAAADSAEAAAASANAAAQSAGNAATSATAAAESKEAAAATAENIKDSLDQIAENKAAVSQLKEATAKLKDGKISKFYASSQGNTNLPDSDDGRIMDLMLYGKSEQKQYSGKNLWSFGDITTATESGIPMQIPAGTYTLTRVGTGNLSLRFYWGTTDEESVLIKVGESTQYQIQLDHDINTINFNVGGFSAPIKNIQLEKGSTATDYEPYTGGIPSPNPEYPQEIKNVVNPMVKVTGKNLLKIKLAEASTAGGITYISNADGSLHLSGTRTSAGALSVENVPVKKGKWTLYVINRTKNELNCYFLTAQNTTLETKCFDVAEDTITTLQIKGKEDGLVYDGDLYLMLLSGDHTSDAVDYEPYTETSATLPYTLHAIPVASGGNVVIDGQQYIADYVDVERGKLVRWISSVELTGTESWSYTDATITTSNRFGISFPTCKAYVGMSDALVNAGEKIIGSDNAFSLYGSWIDVRYTACDSVDAFKSFLAQRKSDGNAIKIHYALAASTETDLTADEIAAFKALVSHYPVTNVSTTSDQLDGYTVFDYPISLANGWNYVKQQLGDTRDYLYGIDLMTAEAYVNSEYAAALAEIEV